MFSKFNFHSVHHSQVMTLNIADENNQSYTAYLIIKRNRIEHLKKAAHSGAAFKLEEYGMIYCSVPGSSVSDSLHSEILERIKYIYGVRE